MKLKEFLNKIQGVNPDSELYVNSNIVSEVVLQDGKICLSLENSLEAYYNYQGKIQCLRDMIADLKKDEVIEISEIEAVQLAHNTELDCIDVIGELTKAHILISKGD